MELLSANFINTTTQIAVSSNSATSNYLFNPDLQLQYQTDGFADDLTQTTIRINFDSTLTIDRIALLEHNLRSFQIYYNGATANLLTISGPTTTTNFTTNSQTSHYLTLPTPLACTSLSFDVKKTIVANAEKAIGFLMISAQELDFTRIPNAAGYTPSLEPKQIVHQMSDGGTRVHSVRDKWKIKLKLAHVDSTMRDDLRTVYNSHENFMFAPWGTHTGWDGILFECVWVGPFSFYKYSDNAATAGFTGDIEFRET